MKPKKKLTISTATWILLIVGILVVGLVSLGMTYNVNQEKQTKLNEELLEAQLRLKKFHPEQRTTEREQLEKQLEQAQTQLDKTKSLLSQPLTSIDTDDAILSLSEKYSVHVTEISSPGLDSETVSRISRFSLPLTIRVDGDITNIIGFIAGLQQNYTASVIKSIEISFAEAGSEDNTTARVLMMIHNYGVE